MYPFVSASIRVAESALRRTQGWTNPQPSVTSLLVAHRLSGRSSPRPRA